VLGEFTALPQTSYLYLRGSLLRGGRGRDLPDQCMSNCFLRACKQAVNGIQNSLKPKNVFCDKSVGCVMLGKPRSAKEMLKLLYNCNFSNI